MLVKDDGISRVWIADGYVYKINRPKLMADNEWHALNALAGSFAPRAWRVDTHTIKMELVQRERVTNRKKFARQCERALRELHNRGLRHGDLTRPHVLVRDNSPVLIDWGESRVWCDTRPQKRPEGDAYWLRRTMEELCEENN